MKRLLLAAVAASVVAVAMPVKPVDAQTMRIALREDPDIMDPTLARTYVGRIVFASICDKLFDIDKDLNIVPQLATGFTWDDPKTLTITLREGVKFHDGETMDANAVVYSLNRHLTMQGSFRRGEINAMDRVEAVDAKTIRIHLKVPFAPFLAQLTDRAGMVVSPKAAEAAGRDFGLRPVCAGPFRFVERVAQDRIVVERFPDYWDKDNVHLDRVIYLPIPDSTVRLANLQSGAIELTETISATDIPAVQRNQRLRVAMGDELGYQGITFNIANGDRARTPIGQHAKVRQAFDYAIDRATIIQVVYEGQFTPTAQAVPPSSPYYVRSLNPPTRDVARAQALLREAGVSTPVRIELTVPNSPDLRQVGEVIQAMAGEAGFQVTVRAMEFASSLQAAQRGDFEAYLVGWSGRTDPDGNLWNFVHSRGAQNDGKYANAEVDRLLDASREEADQEKRVAIFERMYRHYITEDRGRLYLWHRKNIHAYSARVTGFVPVPDGLIRVKGVRLAAN